MGVSRSALDDDCDLFCVLRKGNQPDGWEDGEESANSGWK